MQDSRVLLLAVLVAADMATIMVRMDSRHFRISGLLSVRRNGSTVC